MSNANPQNPDSTVTPFFVRYLEGQYCEDLSEDEMATISGGEIVKIKADREDEYGGDPATMKYPSDQEDGSGGAMTQKYPSDQEDGGSGFPNITVPPLPEFPK
jgi:hypothetical protein